MISLTLVKFIDVLTLYFHIIDPLKSIDSIQEMIVHILLKKFSKLFVNIMIIDITLDSLKLFVLM